MKIIRNDVTEVSTICCNQCERQVLLAIETADGERICQDCAVQAVHDIAKAYDALLVGKIRKTQEGSETLDQAQAPETPQG
jgi:hypothetical protein